jgi:shikimate kinase
MNVVLIGMKHCGKSTVARGLAKRLGGTALDTDDLLADLYAQDAGRRKSVRDIFRELGDDGFAELERRACRAVVDRVEQGEMNLAVALGGRTATREDLHALIKRIGTVVYLQADAEALFARVMRGGLPPFLDPADPKGSFLALCRQREPIHEQFADVAINTDGLAPNDVVAAIFARLTREKPSTA